jgi:hypothetical protein
MNGKRYIYAPKQLVMKLHHVMVLALTAFFLVGCEKEETAPPAAPVDSRSCAVNNYAWIQVTNQSTYSYRFFIDGDLIATMPGGTIIDSIQINQGNNRELYALQQDGYILFPTERTATLNVVECSNYTWSFP